MRLADPTGTLMAMKAILLVAVASSSLLFGACCAVCPVGPDTGTPSAKGEAQAFLDAYTAEFQRLYYTSAEAEWASNTRIVEGDDTNATRTRAANEAMAAFTGSVAPANSRAENMIIAGLLNIGLTPCLGL